MGARILELRVHGVANTVPADMLALPTPPDGPPFLVAGDPTTGFHRATASTSQEDDPARRADSGVAVEAYSWGQLTSGPRRARIRAVEDLQRALWTVLLPFSLANMALYARPDVPADPSRETWRSRAGVAGWLVRLLCLSLTATFALAATGAGVDLFAWQCVGSCVEVLSPRLEFLTTGWWAQTSRPLAIGLLVPVGVVLLVWLVARRSHRYEAALPEEPPDGEQSNRLANPLQRPECWRGAGQVRRLGVLHLATGLAVAAAVPLGAMIHLDPPAGGRALAAWTTLAVLALAVLLAVILLAHPDVAHRRGAPALGWSARSVLTLAGLGLAGTVVYLLAGTAVDLAGHRPPPGCAENPAQPYCDQDLSLPGYDWVIAWLAAGQLLLLLALAGVGRTGRRALAVPALAAAALAAGYGWGEGWDTWLPALAIVGLAAVVTLALPRSKSLREQDVADPHARVAWGGRGPAVLGGLGWALGMMYSAGVLYGVTDLLNRDATPTGVSSITPPAPLLWSAFGLVLAAIALLVTGATLLTRWRRHQRASLLEVTTDPHFTRGGEALSAHERQRAGTVARAYGLHRLIERDGIRGVGVLALLGAAVATVGTAAVLAGVRPPLPHPGPSPHEWERFGRALFKTVVDIGGSLAALLPLIIAVIGFLIYRNETFRRSFSVVWDIATFWPRGAHPLAPPCYAEMAVPQLQTRIAGLLHLPAGHPHRVDGVILAGHSQGAVMCVAALLQLPEPVRRRVWLLTFGCQLNRLYGRVFPAYFGPARLGAVAATLTDGEATPRWTNLWRETDPLGYPVRTGEREPQARDVPMADPEALRPVGGEVRDPPIRGHSNYQVDLAYLTERDRAAELLR